MDRLIAGCVIILLLIIGFVNIYRDKKHYRNKVDFAKEFLSQFALYTKSQGKDSSTYSWLIQKTPKMQSAMGQYGEMHYYTPPYSGVMYKDYQIIINLIPEIRKEAGRESILQNIDALNNYTNLIHESILRYIGSLDDHLDNIKKELRNPIVWLREGVKWILLIPVLAFYWLGIIGETILDKIVQNILFKLFSGLIALLGLLSTLITIISGWDTFVGFLEKVGII